MSETRQGGGNAEEMRVHSRTSRALHNVLPRQAPWHMLRTETSSMWSLDHVSLKIHEGG